MHTLEEVQYNTMDVRNPHLQLVESSQGVWPRHLCQSLQNNKAYSLLPATGLNHES